MALSADTAWEIRSGGNDTNGGGFVAGSGGVDYSQQNAPQLSVADAACTGNTTVTSTTGGFTAAMVGSIMYLSSGPGWYQITARASSNSITIDRAGPNASGMTANIGGALATLGKFAAVMQTNFAKAFVKGGTTYQQSATVNFGGLNGHISGYTTTRGDGGQATIQLITNTGLTALSGLSAESVIENFVIDCNSLGTSTGISVNNGTVRNCKISNFTTAGITVANSAGFSIIGCEITAGSSAATGAIALGASDGGTIWSCNIHDNACPGIVIGNNSSVDVMFNRIVNNTGAASDGIITTATSGGQRQTILNNTIYGSGRDGIRTLPVSSFKMLMPGIIKNNILVNNGGFGLKSTGTVRAEFWYDGNAYFNNTGGTRSGVDDTSGAPIDGITPYVNVFDITLSASPFTNAGTGDFTLNTTAGGGTACRAAGTPGAFPGVAQLGYLDMGCFQSQAASGGGGRVVGGTGVVG